MLHFYNTKTGSVQEKGFGSKKKRGHPTLIDIYDANSNGTLDGSARVHGSLEISVQQEARGSHRPLMVLMVLLKPYRQCLRPVGGCMTMAEGCMGMAKSCKELPMVDGLKDRNV